jgi:membrane protease YdiL (CAAX protease family)
MAGSRRLYLFLALTFALSSIPYARIIGAGKLGVDGGAWVLMLMWSPGLAALGTKLALDRTLRGLGWGWGGTRWQLLSYATPPLYALVAYGALWSAGWGGVPNAAFLERAARRLGLEGATTAATLGAAVGVAATIGVLFSCLSALGEELGWRGFLVPELARRLPFTQVCLVSGGIWAVWHWPVLLFADYNAGTPLWYGLACFTLMVVGISPIYAWLRLRSGSLWTGMLLHATHNLYVQGVFDPLTVDFAATPYLRGEFGALLALTGGLAGSLFWRRRGDLAGVGGRAQ